MGRIFYSLAGEGRGHATRVRTLTEHLRAQHEVHLFAPGDAYAFLAPLYEGSEVRVHPLPGLFFHYDGRRRIDRRATLRAAASYLRGLRALVTDLRRRIEQEAPDLVLTDFEPALPRAARAAGVPFLSLSHQHFLVVSDLSSLPLRLRAQALALRACVGRWYSGQEETIVSSFYRPPLAPAHIDAVQVGVLIRPELAALVPEPGEHLLAYFRREPPAGALEALSDCGREVRLYSGGLAEGRQGRLTVRRIGSPRFLEDLVGAAAVVSTAGNQLVGEALHLCKPVCASPEAGNVEQEINAHFLAASGAGHAAEPGRLGPRVLAEFLASLDARRVAAAELEEVDGTRRALARVEHHLRIARRPAPARGLVQIA